ncbi:MAG: ABC transporter ATP-binding protein [Oscillospiraceae bacterium]|nr:ABC transporter ATP-binding protein [Oscillospiraceae bacterium]
MQRENNPVLSVRDLVVEFELRGQTLTAVRGASLELYGGESLAIVGESGSGKSVLVKSLMGMLDKNGRIAGGSITYDGRDLTRFTTEREWLTIRGREIAMVMQDPMTSLNPLKTIGEQIGEAIALHQNLRGTAKRDAIHGMIKDVGISDPLGRAKQYPHEFSGGMRQRVVIAIAMACRPKILICDEPTTALDVTIQAQILELIKTLQRRYNLTVIYITHDLGVVARVADRVAVMYAGEVVEQGTTEEVFFEPAHPYTWALLSSLPQLGRKGEMLYAIEGTPPSLFETIKGDAFAPRNTRALRIDALYAPPSFQITPTHSAKTWLLDPLAPKIEPPEVIRRLKG